MEADEFEKAVVTFLLHAPGEPALADRAVDLFLARFDGPDEKSAALNRLVLALAGERRAEPARTAVGGIRRRG